jgi:hypothetical protein
MLTSSVVLFLATAAGAPSSVGLELEAGVGSMSSRCCSWLLTIAADGTAVVKVAPAAHLSRKFTLSRERLSDLEGLLAREDFFALPPEMGELPIDGAAAQIRVLRGGRQHQVRLNDLPKALVPIWRTDPTQFGRAFRVCEYLRGLTGVTEALHCPGILDDPP